MTTFNTLPNKVKAEVKKRLKMFPAVHVIFEYGEYKVSTGICIDATYAADHKFIGRYTDKEIFTPEERIVNYVESFHDYPIEYKGKRNYQWLNSLTWKDHVKYDENGNLVTA